LKVEIKVEYEAADDPEQGVSIEGFAQTLLLHFRNFNLDSFDAAGMREFYLCN